MSLPSPPGDDAVRTGMARGDRSAGHAMRVDVPPGSGPGAAAVPVPGAGVETICWPKLTVAKDIAAIALNRCRSLSWVDLIIFLVRGSARRSSISLVWADPATTPQ